MNGKVSHVKQYLEEQEKRSREKPNILSNRKHRSSSLDERDGNSFLLRSNNNQNKELATFTNGKGVRNMDNINLGIIDTKLFNVGKNVCILNK